MKILYGIQLTGNGHLTRSIELISQLKNRGFEVDILVSGNNYSVNIPFDIKYRFDGVSIFYNKQGEVNWGKTLGSIKLFRFIRNTNLNVSEYDLVISDYEPISCWSAKRYKVKSIGLSNQYTIFSKNNLSFRHKLLRFFSKIFTPCSHYISLDYQSNSKYNIFQPIISDKFIGVKEKSNKSILIYLPSIKLTTVLESITTYKYIKWIIYSDEVEKDVQVKNISVNKINREKFQSDLINCEGVITASGFSTTSEALILGKKLWSIPLKFHAEQQLNASSLEEMGIFTDDLNQHNIYKWIFNYKRVKYNWSNPIDKIINLIIELKKN